MGADLWYWSQVLRSIPALRAASGRSAHGRARGLATDLLHLGRAIRREPVTPAAAVVTLAVALGAGTAIFSVADAVLLEPPPFEDPARLVVVREEVGGDGGGARAAVDFARFEAWRVRSAGLATIEGWDPTNLTLGGPGLAGPGPPERIGATDVTPDFLPLLGARPFLGRGFEQDDVGQPVALVSHRFWRDRLGGDAAALGWSLTLNGAPHEVVGVLPEGFDFALDPGEVWRPMPFGTAESVERGVRIRVMARLRGDVRPEDLADVLDGIGSPGAPPTRVRTTPVAAAIAGDAARTLALLAAAAALSLLVAFANLAVLLMVRSLDRGRELAVRRAVGAGRHEAAWQLTLEAMVLVVAGLASGAALASWITPTVAGLALEMGGVAGREVAASWRAIGAVGGAALLSAGGCALLAAAGADRGDAMAALRTRASTSSRVRGVRRAFVTGEVAVALVLLVSMAAVGQSLLHVLGTDPGFEAGGVVKLQVSLPAAEYPTREDVTAFHAELRRALEGRLGPGTASMIDELPLAGGAGLRSVRSDRSEAGEAVVRTAAPGYFDVMGIPVVAGRPFTPGDDAGAPARAVISEALAGRLFGADAPVGREVAVDGVAGEAEVVGVVGDVKHRALDEAPVPTLYLSALQSPSASSVLVVRSSRPEAAVIAVVREEVGRLDPHLPVYGVRSLADVVASSPGVPARRVLAATLAAFATLALTLAVVGVFGVTAQEVSSRRAELALRIALGAAPRSILAATVRGGSSLILRGLAVGGVLAALAVRGLGSVTLVEPSRLAVLGLGAGALLLSAGVAALLPVAVRAARSDPRGGLGGE